MIQESKRILLISYYFAPHNRIGAVRPTKLAKYLTREGHQVTVICGTGFDGGEDPAMRRDLGELKDVHVIREWSPLRSMLMRKANAASAAAPSAAPRPKAQPSKGGVKKLVKRCVDMAYRYLRWMAEQDFRRLFLRISHSISLKPLEHPQSCYLKCNDIHIHRFQ